MVTPVQIPLQEIETSESNSEDNPSGQSSVNPAAAATSSLVESIILSSVSGESIPQGSIEDLIDNEDIGGGGGVICISDSERPDPADYLIPITYINGSWQTRIEAQTEGMHISEIRNGEPVRVLYNSGRGISAEGLLNRRYTTSPLNPLCRSLFEILRAFFSHPENERRRYTLIFFGDGGIFIQQVLDHSPYAERVDCIGIAPTTYVVGHQNVYHFRVTGDVLTLRDRYGYSHANNVRTLGYSSGAESISTPGLRCPSYQYVLGMQDPSQLNAGHETTDPAVAMALIQIGSDMNVFAESEYLYNTRTTHEAIVNASPSTLPDTVLTGIFLIPSIVALMQDVFVRSILFPEDQYFYWVSHTGYLLNLLQRFTLLLTNPRSLRFGWRRFRLIARTLTCPILLISAAESMNYMQRMQRPIPLLQAIYIGGSVMSGTWVFLAFGNTFLTHLRLRAQRFGLRVMNDPEYMHRGDGRSIVLRVADAGRRRVAEALPNMLAGVVAGIGAGVLNACSISSPLSTGQRAAYLNATGQASNRTEIFDPEILRDPAVAWRTGDWFGLSATISLILGIIVICTTIGVMVNSVRLNRHRR
ncbi:DUF687 family protein [Chlamydia sp. 17-3921]|uniref:DUF687 family protein n=1 Tax=Chlamydia sp. 17-3921 TaxID=2675798 RepID=UPI00191A40FC|nr:DUF687 family protein [Chlamydia sp. 17-3921]